MSFLIQQNHPFTMNILRIQILFLRNPYPKESSQLRYQLLQVLYHLRKIVLSNASFRTEGFQLAFCTQCPTPSCHSLLKVSCLFLVRVHLGLQYFAKNRVKIGTGEAVTEHKDLKRLLKIQNSEPRDNGIFNKIKQINFAAN